jgi:putative OPT family oligopeptide transporter
MAWIGVLTLVLLVVLAVTFGYFLAPAPLDTGATWRLVGCAVLFAFVFGFLVAAACGYMAGLVGSSASPISGIGIIAVILVSLLILGIGTLDGLLDTPEGGKYAIALAIFTTSAVVAVASISNDNLQDLKTGWLVGATPWRQQVALLIGCAVGAAVIPPVLELLYHAYGFAGALPRADMDPNQALAAPQATLMTAIATGIFTHKLNWTMILIGVALGVVLIAIDEVLRHRGGVARLPVLAVGIGIYLPPTISSALVVGAVLSWWLLRTERKRAEARGDDVPTVLAHAERRGTLLASGLIVGESLVGVALAAVIGLSGKEAPLALVGEGLALRRSGWDWPCSCWSAWDSAVGCWLHVSPAGRSTRQYRGYRRFPSFAWRERAQRSDPSASSGRSGDGVSPGLPPITYFSTPRRPGRSACSVPSRTDGTCYPAPRQLPCRRWGI